MTQQTGSRTNRSLFGGKNFTASWSLLLKGGDEITVPSSPNVTLAYVLCLESNKRNDHIIGESLTSRIVNLLVRKFDVHVDISPNLTHCELFIPSLQGSEGNQFFSTYLGGANGANWQDGLAQEVRRNTPQHKMNLNLNLN
jgi:hypothetical protein